MIPVSELPFGNFFANVGEMDIHVNLIGCARIVFGGSQIGKFTPHEINGLRAMGRSFADV
jgi:hypothetical protein